MLSAEVNRRDHQNKPSFYLHLMTLFFSRLKDCHEDCLQSSEFVLSTFFLGSWVKTIQRLWCVVALDQTYFKFSKEKISANRETLQVVHNTVTPKAYPNKPHNYLKISSSFGVIWYITALSISLLILVNPFLGLVQMCTGISENEVLIETDLCSGDNFSTVSEIISIHTN